MDSPSTNGSPNATIGHHDANEVIMPTPPEHYNVRATKQLARLKGHYDDEGPSKRLQTIERFCEHNEASQKECKELLHKLFTQIGVVLGEEGRPMTFREEIMLTLRGIKDDTARLESNQLELYSFVDNFQSETVQRLSFCFKKHEEKVQSLQGQVAHLNSEIQTLKMAINRLNAIEKRISRIVMPDTNGRSKAIKHGM